MRNLVAALIVRFVDRLSQPARNSARAVGEIEKAQRMAKRAGEQWSRGLDDLDGKLDRLSKVALVTEGLDRAGQAMMRPLKAATANASEFDAAMTGIGITAQLSDRQLLPLRRTIIDTATDLGALPATVQGTFGAVLAEGVYRTEAELSRAGVAVARFQRLQAAMGEPLSDQEAGSWSSALGSSLKLRADQLERANAMANRSAQQGGVSGASLARALPAQTGALAGLGFGNERGLADLLTANQLAKRLAGSSDQATNNITNLMSALASPEVMKRFEGIGINLEREIKRGVAAGRSPLETLARVTRDATKADQFRIGELFGDRQARDGLMALVQNFDDFQEMSRQLQAADVVPGYLADIERASSGSAASFARYQSSVARAGIATGTILAPAAGLGADALGRLANWMATAAENGSPLARVGVYATAGFAGMAVGAGAVGNALMGVLGPMFIMKSMFGDLGGAVVKRFASAVVANLARARMAAMAFNLTMLANPVVLAVAAAIAAVAIVAVLVRKYWQPIKAFFGGFAQGLGQAFAPLGAMLAPLKPVWDGFVGLLGKAWSWITRLLQPVQSTSGQLASASSAGQRFGQIIGGVFMALTLPIRTFMGIAQAGWPILRRLFSFTPLGMILANWRPIIGAVQGIIARVQAVFAGGWRGLPGRFVALGLAIMQGLVRGILSGAGNVGRAIVQAGGRVVNGFKNRLGIRSPSRVFAGLGGDTMAGLAIGLGRGAPRAIAAVAAVGASMASAIPAVAGPVVSVQRPDPSAALASILNDDAPGRRPPPPPAGAGGMTQNITQNFYLPAGAPTDIRALARELKRLGDAGQRRAMNDGELP